MPICFRLLVHWARASRAACTAGNKSAINTAMMAITTSSSINVKPRGFDGPCNEPMIATLFHKEPGPAQAKTHLVPLRSRPAGSEADQKALLSADRERPAIRAISVQQASGTTLTPDRVNDPASATSN